MKHQEGVCPICGSMEITYDSSDIDGNVYYYKCCCDKCNATFNECYDLTFIGMEEIIKGE